jgi:hypothetical protein
MRTRHPSQSGWVHRVRYLSSVGRRRYQTSISEQYEYSYYFACRDGGISPWRLPCIEPLPSRQQPQPGNPLHRAASVKAELVGPNFGPKLPNAGRNTATQAGLSALRNSRKIRLGDTQRHSMQLLSAIKKIGVFCGFFPGRCLGHCSLQLMSRRIGCQPLCHGCTPVNLRHTRLRTV